MNELVRAERPPQLRRFLTNAAIGIAVSVGLIMILAVMALGGCDAFGGACPDERPPLWEDDTFGTAAVGTALVVAVPMFLIRPSKRRFVLALVVGFVAAMVVGLA